MLNSYHDLHIDDEQITKISWSRKLKKLKSQNQSINYDSKSVVTAMYRPFVGNTCIINQR